MTKQNRVRNVTENPCNMCMPMGAIVPFKGIENAMIIIHGSQGCATYMRRHMAEHFNEPIDVASSSITEQGTIYGGENNLKKGLENVMQLYKPELVGILSTCLAETIGEDLGRTASSFTREQGEGFTARLVPVSTPGYGGGHYEGYIQALYSIVVQLSQKTEKHDRINVFVPHISPADIREIKRILELMEIKYTLLPDISETLDSPYIQPYRRIPAGGTPLQEIEAMPGARATIEFMTMLEDELSPGKYLESEFGVPLYRLPLPMGIEACDELLRVLKKLSSKAVPEVIKKERGRLLDAMVDSHKYNGAGRAAVFAEPEVLYGVTRIMAENGILPAVLATGSKSPALKKLLQSLTADCDEKAIILLDSDFVSIQDHCANRKINLAVGNSDGRFISEQVGIPLVRIGFPIHDRIGGQRILSVGYNGTMMLMDRITNTLLAEKLSSYRQDMYQSLYKYPSAAANDH